jgi:hypothetical protein
MVVSEACLYMYCTIGVQLYISMVARRLGVGGHVHACMMSRRLFLLPGEVFGAGAFDLEESTATATSTLF